MKKKHIYLLCYPEIIFDLRLICTLRSTYNSQQNPALPEVFISQQVNCQPSHTILKFFNACIGADFSYLKLNYQEKFNRLELIMKILESDSVQDVGTALARIEDSNLMERHLSAFVKRYFKNEKKIVPFSRLGVSSKLKMDPSFFFPKKTAITTTHKSVRPIAHLSQPKLFIYPNRPSSDSSLNKVANSLYLPAKGTSQLMGELCRIAAEGQKNTHKNVVPSAAVDLLLRSFAVCLLEAKNPSEVLEKGFYASDEILNLAKSRLKDINFESLRENVATAGKI
jgi:hypothetical protein